MPMQSSTGGLFCARRDVDWHCHILPGIDDGSGSLSESVAIARQLVESGFSEVYCTPHCLQGLYANGADSVRLAVAQLQKQLIAEKIPLQLHAGMEYYLDEFFPSRWPEILPLGESRALLVETSPQAEPDQVKNALFQIRQQGFTPLLAHPERYAYLFPPVHKTPRHNWLRRLSGCRRDNPDSLPSPMVNDLLQMGCLFQGNLGSFAGIYGSEVQARALSLLHAGAYSCFGSDAHRAKNLAQMIGLAMANIRAAQV